MRTWRGLKALLHDAVDATAELVREGNDSTARTVLRATDLIPGLKAPARAVDEVRRVSTSTVLGTIKGLNRVVETVSNYGLDRALADKAEPGEMKAVAMRSDAPGGLPWAGDAALALVNAAVGDHLHGKANDLDLGMTFRVGDRYVPLTTGAPYPREDGGPEPSPKVVLFVHGLGTTEWSWCLEAQAYHGDPSASFGSLLERDLGYSPIFLRYNTGRHISDNGRLLAAQLEQLVAVYPVPIEELVLVGHSMGGLVVRSACHYAAQQQLGWLASLRRVFCLGAPHRGAPLARFGHLLADVLGSIDLPGTRIPARILDKRSAGIQDLQNGAVVDEDWLIPAQDVLTQVPTVDDSWPDSRSDRLAHVVYHFVSATVTRDPQHPLGRLMGDLLVQTPSASGPDVRTHSFLIDTQHYGGVMHHQLQNHPAVYEQIRAACESESG